MYAVKANKIYEIEAAEKQKFIDRGYKIAELKDGKLDFEEVETEETKEIAKLVDENKKLKAEVKKLEKAKGEGK
ncbi:hypothetical protein GOQ29_05035 [Clostridium sp. D2Q-14]|uniref:hypothetical protein n=1 Tax=Anaeromonas gelatinilytica TaxID=2683194 RepID=UPI00193B2059|nr:hypothetical protein [Anaeromonas gelatinilytica]MBS4534981.1 hypothetical protein [Anaeromonas gelatinilytica]